MQIIDIREQALPLEANIHNAVVSFADHTVSLVLVVSDIVRNGRPVAGVAFNSIGRYAQSGLLRERFLRRLRETSSEDLLDDEGHGFDPAKTVACMMRNEKPGGHGDRAHAVAAIELALWDLNSKLAGVPAWRLIADRFGVTPADAMPVYAAGGYYYPDDNLKRLADEMRRYRDLGYGYFKMKIGGADLAEDMRRIEAALSVVGEPARLAVDANGRFDSVLALTYGREIAPMGLRWYEEPGDPLDYAVMNELAEAYPHALATGENLFSCRDLENLLRYGGMRPGLDLFQMDPALSYGLGETVRMIERLEQRGYSRAQFHPHGGHMIALHIVVGLGLGGSEAYPGVFAPFGGYAPDCAVDETGVRPGEAPGFGLESKPDLASHVARLVEGAV